MDDGRANVTPLGEPLFDFLLLLQGTHKSRLEPVRVLGFQGFLDVVCNALVAHDSWLLYYSIRNPLVHRPEWRKKTNSDIILRVAALSHFQSDEKSVPHCEQMNGMGGVGWSTPAVSRSTTASNPSR